MTMQSARNRSSGKHTALDREAREIASQALLAVIVHLKNVLLVSETMLINAITLPIQAIRTPQAVWLAQAV